MRDSVIICISELIIVRGGLWFIPHCIQPILNVVHLLTKYFMYNLKVAIVKCRNM